MKKWFLFSVFIILFSPVQAHRQQEEEKGFPFLQEQARELYLNGDYPAAYSLYIQTLELTGKESGENSLEYSVSLNGLANVYTMLSRYSEADSLFMEALKIRKEKTKGQGVEYAETLTDLLFLKINSLDFTDYATYGQTALKIREKAFGEESVEYIETLLNLAGCYLFSGKEEKAGDILETACSTLYNQIGENNSLYGYGMSYMGSYFFFRQNYGEAESYYRKSADIFRNVYGEKHPLFLKSQLAVSTVLAGKEDYSGCISLIEAILPDLEKLYGKEHSDYCAALSNMGTALLLQAKYGQAEKVLKECISLIEKVLGKDHTYYFNALNALAIVYQKSGYYEKAEPLLNESLALRKKFYGETHSSVVNALNSLSLYYSDMGDYEQAEYLLKQAGDIIRDLSGENTPAYSLNLTNLGLVYMAKKEYRQAFPVLEKALEITGESLGEENTTYLTIQGFLLSLLSFDDTYQGRTYPELLTDLLEKQKKIMGPGHPDYIIKLFDLAQWHHHRGEPEEAGNIYRECILLLKESENRKPYLLIHLLLLWGTVKAESGDTDAAYTILYAGLEEIRHQIEENFLFLTEKEKELFWDTRFGFIKHFQSVAYQYRNENPLFGILAYDCELFLKGLLLNSSRSIHQTILNCESEDLIDMWNAFNEVKKIVVTYEEAIRDLEMQCREIFVIPPAEDIETELEKRQDENAVSMLELIRSIKDDYRETLEFLKDEERFFIGETRVLSRQQQELALKWEDMQKQLKKEEAAIEFINFLQTDKEDHRGSLFYAAVIIRPDSEVPVLIGLCEEEELSALLEDFTVHTETIYQLLWKPLEVHLQDIHTIYLSPSGLLHNVPFHALKSEEMYTGEMFSLHHLLSTKDISGLKEKEIHLTGEKHAVLFGGADYSLSPGELKEEEENRSIPELNTLTRGILDSIDPARGQGFDYLPGSEKEVKLIGEKLKELGWHTRVYIDKQATESHFKLHSGPSSLELLHISTHGFYFPPPGYETKLEILMTEEYSAGRDFRIANNPLMRSGLVFSGANQAWSGKEIDSETEDGLLTALEVSSLNLENTRLVVLSACESGLGDATVSEGIYGLQRAFHIAGAKKMMVSLWEIPDKETVELMDLFYTEWTHGKSIHQSFSIAWKQLKNKYPVSPEKWAGFILIE